MNRSLKGGRFFVATLYRDFAIATGKLHLTIPAQAPKYNQTITTARWPEHTMTNRLFENHSFAYPLHATNNAGNGKDDDGDDLGRGTTTVTRTKPKTKKPSMYRVLLLNDDYSPMEFVVHVLERFFQKNVEEATRIMLHVHQNGVGECGVYTYEVAETKVVQVMDLAKQHQHPLQCVMEKK